MIHLETLIGILTFLCINILFFRQIYIILKNKMINGYLYISLILFLIQIANVINSKFEYNGHYQEEFSSLFAYKISVVAYYIGFHMFEIVAVIINQIIISKEKRKIMLKDKEKEIQEDKENKALNDLILNLEKEKSKEEKSNGE